MVAAQTCLDGISPQPPVNGSRAGGNLSKEEKPARVLVLIPTYLPGYKAGGPVRTIANMVAKLGDEFEFKLVTLDRDLGDKSPFPGIIVNRWVRVGRADVMYLRTDIRGLLRIWTLLRLVDRDTVIYLNSFFARRFSMLAVLMHRLKLCQPKYLVLAPRGEFSPGALQFKRARKHLYIRIFQWIGLDRGLIWHCSSDLEASDISRVFSHWKGAHIAIDVPGLNASDENELMNSTATESHIASAPPKRRPKRRGHLHLVFVSRISRKKNLAGALTMLAALSGDITFDIYGPAEDAEYWNGCQRIIAEMPPNIRVRYEGEIEHERVGKIFAEHDLFLFPTLGENYGHVICEALGRGCPVLISDQTPWRDLESEGVGWDIPLDETDRFRSILQRCVDAEEEWFSALSERAMAYAVKRSAAPEIITRNRQLFLYEPNQLCIK